ncbi:MAG: hypothetical protein C4533_08150 [Candidatus Omnitrophota bacterium]|jgi:Flp pilus assembly pilin Flp|nr:MAG: hypothetical protein C4533_08150 [Candidatus Omnitrophota bacterium]
MLKILGKRAQTTAEYAVLIALVVGAVVAMQVYVRRGLQGRIRNVVDHVDSGGPVGQDEDQFTFTAEQYEPYYLSSQSATARESTQQEILGRGGEVGRGTAEATGVQRQQIMGWDDTTLATPVAAPSVTEPGMPTVPQPENVE